MEYHNPPISDERKPDTGECISGNLSPGSSHEVAKVCPESGGFGKTSRIEGHDSL